MPQLDIRVCRIEHEPYLTRRFALYVAWFVFVGEVHEVVGEGGVVVVLEATWGEFPCDEGVDVWLRKTCFRMPS